MSLWVDSHRPNTLSKLTLNPSITHKLQALSRGDELPHLLFYGPAGSGKKTRVMTLLREIYGPSVEKIKLEHRSFRANSSKIIEITTLGSNYHIECNPSDAGNNDRLVIQEIIKEIASHGTLQSATVGAKSFKVVILTEVDRLSRQAQAALRRTMEKYSSQCRIILVCNSPSKLIEPLRSRCLGIRIPAPSYEDIGRILVDIARKENCPCPQELAMKIAVSSDRNIRRALLMMEVCKAQNPTGSLAADLPVQLPDWEMYIIRMARDILQEQTPTQLLKIRDMFYELLTNCIPPDVIMVTLTRELMKALDDTLKHELSFWSAYYEHRIHQGSKEIFHLEAFVAKFMAIYKRWIVSMFS